MFLLKGRKLYPTIRRYADRHFPLYAINDFEQSLYTHISSFKALALFFQFDDVDSPSPLLVFPPGTPRQHRFKSTEYLSIVLYAKLGAGAVGDTYAARVFGFPTSFVVKMAITERAVLRLKHEYKVYRHLHDAGVKGIPSLLGFHEDNGGSVCILSLSNVGRPLGERMNRTRQVHLSDDERYVYSTVLCPILKKCSNEARTILADIHKAGVLHRDIRSWNIMVNDSGHISIIDFDRGSFLGTESEYQEEKDRLGEFMGGRYIDRNSVIGTDDLCT